MNTVKFIEERNRMCRSFNTGCKECPAFTTCEDDIGSFCAVGQESMVDAKIQIAIVEKWCNAHPHKTRQDMFLEQWPDAKIEDNGVLSLCPIIISSTYRNQYGGCKTPYASCGDCCREFWMQEVE